MVAQILFFFAVALLLAMVEIEIERKHGWAEMLPTWYRTTGFCAYVWRLIAGGKPLTGYHLFFNGLLIAMFHVGFVMGLEWSWKAESVILARYSVTAVFWDFLWFVLNPFYGVKNYKRKNIWWFAKSYWVLDLFPIDYLLGLLFSLGLAYLGGDLNTQLVMIGGFLALTFLAIVFAPLYRRWYWAMRRSDDRGKAGIFHTLPERKPLDL